MNKGKVLYLECNAGISGDMAVAALLDLGADQEVLEKVLESLPVKGFRTRIGRAKKAGLDVCDFAVLLDDAHENHDHDMKYLHGGGGMCTQEEAHMHSHVHGHTHEEGHTHEHVHEQEEGHTHDEQHIHPHVHHHHHEHRGLSGILHIISHAQMTEAAKDIATRIFEILAEAEAKAHGVPKSEVHFHEVGAVDSIVDIIAAAVCLDNLGIEKCVIPVLCEGCGTVRCQHGVLPIPVPAVANIVADNGLKLTITETKGEFVTPTGAAIAAAIKTDEKLPERFAVERIGMGGGKREYERPSILRAMLIREDEEKPQDKDMIWKLETNMDDCTGEALGYVMEKLMQAGARDVNYIPLYMKKNRPGYQLNVICTEDVVKDLERIIFEETTTIGIRRQQMGRTVLPRRIQTMQTSLGAVQVKECEVSGRVRRYPEYDSVAEVCRTNGRAFQDVYRLIERECNE